MKIHILIFWFVSTSQAQIGLAPLQSIYPNLQRHLELTNDQLTGISQQRFEYQNYISEKYQRLNQVNQELIFEKTRPAPDPAALGIRYYEIAAICQQSTARQATYKQDLRKLLTPAQSTRLAQLEQQLEFLPSIAEGQELNFVGTEVKTGILQGLPLRNQIRNWQVSPLYGLPSLPGCPARGSSIAAFISGPFEPSALYPNLTRYLILTPEQIGQMQAMTSRLDEDLIEGRLSAGTLQSELEKESALPNPNPSLLGEKAFRLEQICRQSIALESAVEQAMPKILTESQQAKWAEIERALQLLPVLAESQNLRLNSRIPANSLPPLYLSSAPVRRIEWVPLASPNTSLPGCQESIASAGWFDRIGLQEAKKPIFATHPESK